MKSRALLSLIVILLFGLAAAVLLGSGSAKPLPVANAAAAAAPKPQPAPPSRWAKRPPNEAGRIPILMYHAIGGPPHRGHRYDVQGLNIAPQTFRKQLQLMYDAGWYPVNMRDILTAKIDVPAGRTPVVLTFDDARPTQFRYLPNGKIDPNCAVGILEAFHATHPDWPLRASFYVLPQSRWNPAPFAQHKLEARKVRFLVAAGFEIANHSTSHRLMGPLDGATLRWEMAECQRYFQRLDPALTMDTMALPGGVAPRDHRLWLSLLSGQEGGVRYKNRCILEAWGGPSLPWTAKRFDPERVTRIGSGPGEIETWVRLMPRSRHNHPFVSDGDPNTVTVPRSQLGLLNPNRLQGARLVVYDDRARPKKKAPLKVAALAPPALDLSVAERSRR